MDDVHLAHVVRTRGIDPKDFDVAAAKWQRVGFIGLGVLIGVALEIILRFDF